MERSKEITSNLMWRLLERFGAQGVTLIVSIVLARILDPKVYGTIALITVITTIFHVYSIVYNIISFCTIHSKIL